MERVTGRWRVGAELVPVLLVLASVAGSLALVISMHRRAVVRPAPKPQVAVVVPPTIPRRVPKPERPPINLPDPTPPEDPTRQLVAELAHQADDERRLADRADRLAASIEQTTDKANNESSRWRLRESLVRKQVGGLEQEAKKVALQGDELEKLRDALAIRLAIAKEDLAKAQSSTGTAILPYRGTNGTWRRPLTIECSGTGIRLQPSGPSFSVADLETYETMGRRSPVVLALVRELIAVDRNASPDGRPIVPYFLFLVRPDGIRAYYAARDRLELIGIAFGYELVDQDAEFEFPDLNDPQQWRDALDAANLAANSASPGGSGGLKPWMTDGKENGDLGAEGDRGLRPNRGELRGGSPSSGYRGSRMPAGEVDPRWLANLAAGRASDPSDNIPDDGRVELFPSAAPPRPLPVLSPTPHTSGDGPGGSSPNAPAWPGSPGQPLGPPSRSLPSGDRTGSRGLSGGSGNSQSAGGSSGADAAGTAPILLPPRLNGANGSERGSARLNGANGSERGSAGGTETATGSGDSGNETITELPTLVVPSRPADGSQSAASAGGFPRSTSTTGRERGSPGTPPFSDESSAGAPNELTDDAADTVTRPALSPAVGGATGGTSAVSSSARSTSARGSASPSSSTASSSTSSQATGSSAAGASATAGLAGQQGAPPNVPPTIWIEPLKEVLEITIACGPKGVTIHPGGYRFKNQALASADSTLQRTLRAIERTQRQAHPKLDLRPSILYLIEPRGEATYGLVRRQLFISGLDWPSTFRVSEGNPTRYFAREDW